MAQSSSDPIRELLRDMVLFMECVQRTLSSKRDRKSWIRKTGIVADTLKARLADRNTKEALDKLLPEVATIANDPAINKQAAETFHSNAEHFVAVERRLRDVIDLPRATYWRAIAFSQKAPLQTEGSSSEVSLPTTGDEYGEILIGVIDYALVTIQSSGQLPKSEKKEQRAGLGFLMWQRLVGGAITLGNAVHFFQHGGTDYSVSVVCGAGLLGYQGNASRTIARIFNAQSGIKKASGSVGMPLAKRVSNSRRHNT